MLCSTLHAKVQVNGAENDQGLRDQVGRHRKPWGPGFGQLSTDHARSCCLCRGTAASTRGTRARQQRGALAPRCGAQHQQANAMGWRGRRCAQTWPFVTRRGWSGRPWEDRALGFDALVASLASSNQDSCIRFVQNHQETCIRFGLFSRQHGMRPSVLCTRVCS